MEVRQLPLWVGLAWLGLAWGRFRGAGLEKQRAADWRSAAAPFVSVMDFVIASGSLNNNTANENSNTRPQSCNQIYVRSLKCCEPEECFVQTFALWDQVQFDAGNRGRGLSRICFSERGCP